jgi:hypothetical protein
MAKKYRSICSHSGFKEIEEINAIVRPFVDVRFYDSCAHCMQSERRFRIIDRENYAWVYEMGSNTKYHLALIVEDKKPKKKPKKKKVKEKPKKLSELLQRSVFAAHSVEELDTEEELSCYSSEQEALLDPCCAYITELLIVRTRGREEVIEDLKKQGIELKPQVKDDGKRPDGKKVAELMRKAKEAETSIKKLIVRHLNMNLTLNQLSNSHVEYILAQMSKVSVCNNEPARLVEEEAGESPIVGG